MRSVPPGDVEQKARTGPGPLLTGLVIFAMAVTLLLGQTRLYELRQENRQLAEALTRLEETRTELETRAEARDAALTGGLQTPEPEQVEILHIGR